MIVISVGVFFFLHFKKEALTLRCQKAVSALFRRQTDLDVSVARVRGHFLGAVTLEGVRVEAPWLPEGERTLFEAETIRVQYRFLDFLSKKFDSKILVTVQKPRIVWVPRIRLRQNGFPFLSWMREWALSGLQNLQVEAEDLEIRFGEEKKSVRGIRASFSRESFHLEVPLTHATVGRFDVTSSVHVRGWYEPGSESRSDVLRGELVTEGTVVNWKPVDAEAHCDLLLSSDEIRLTSADFLGGFQILARVDFTRDYALEASVKAENYLFSNLAPFLGAPQQFKMADRLDLEADLSGALWEPQVTFRARIHDGWIGKTAFKALDLSGSGVYPTVRLSDSKILMSDGVTMRFADKALELKEFFRSEIFETLVSEAQQERILWGNWELSRPKDDNDLSEFMMQRLLGENARVHFRKYNEDREKPARFAEVEAAPVEFGFEYKLHSKDSVKVEIRDGEKFVSVERKVTF